MLKISALLDTGNLFESLTARENQKYMVLSSFDLNFIKTNGFRYSGSFNISKSK